MEIYLVGGAVRDKLLGHPVIEKDYVIVGATPEEMLARGFLPVGKEFPVFLHPETHEDYALARTERKIGKGYKGFTFYAAPDVSLEDDLKRRDLTINAIAETQEGRIIDPYGGLKDLENKILRHVSPAFEEDPVRILRTARFAAKFPDFSLHPSTLELMRRMVELGEVDALIPERVWQEFSRALESQEPARFIEVLDRCGATPRLFPELHVDKSDLDTLRRASELTHHGPTRMAALLHRQSLESLDQFIARYRVPNEYSQLVLLVAKYGIAYQKSVHADAESLLELITGTDALRRPKRLHHFILACKSAFPNITRTHHKNFNEALQAVKSVNIKTLQDQGLKGKSFAEALKTLRIETISRMIK